MKYFLDIVDPLTHGNILGIHKNLKINIRNIFKLLCLTAMKQVTKLWKQAKSSNEQAWYKTIEQTLKMEKMKSPRPNRKME